VSKFPTQFPSRPADDGTAKLGAWRKAEGKTEMMAENFWPVLRRKFHAIITWPLTRSERWWQGAKLLALIILGFFAVLAAADASMILKDGAQRCGVQFPKWLGCVVANHESLSGSLLTAGGALFAAWVAWNAVRDQIDSTIRPLANIMVGDYEKHVFVKVVNNGAGSMIIKSITINNSPQPLNIALSEALPKDIRWRHFTSGYAVRSVPAGREFVLVDLHSSTYTGVNAGKFAGDRDLVRRELGNITVRVEYTDMYNKNQPASERTLDLFHQPPLYGRPVSAPPSAPT
jgi:hypothetical protein